MKKMINAGLFAIVLLGLITHYVPEVGAKCISRPFVEVNNNAGQDLTLFINYSNGKQDKITPFKVNSKKTIYLDKLDKTKKLPIVFGAEGVDGYTTWDIMSHKRDANGLLKGKTFGINKCPKGYLAWQLVILPGGVSKVIENF